MCKLACANRVGKPVKEMAIAVFWVRCNDVWSWKLVLPDVVKCSRIVTVIHKPMHEARLVVLYVFFAYGCGFFPNL